MKKILKIIFCACIPMFMIQSCSDDDDESASLEGTWEMTSLRTETAFDLDDDGTASTDIFAEGGCYADNFVTFKEDGEVNIYFSLTNITLTLPDETYEYECIEPNLIQTTYTVQGDVVDVDFQSYHATGVINNKTMVVTFEDFFRLPYNNNGSIAYRNEDIEVTFVKSN